MTFEAGRQVTDFFRTEAGNTFEYIHDMVPIPLGEHTPMGFAPETARALIAQEQKVIDNRLSPAHVRKMMYPAAVGFGILTPLVAKLLDSGERMSPQLLIAGGATALAATVGVAELIVSSDKRIAAEAQRRIEDIQQNTIEY